MNYHGPSMRKPLLAAWKSVRLRFLLKEPLKYGLSEAAEIDDPTLPRFIRITDIRPDGTLRDDTFRSLPFDVARPYLLADGDVLLARSGATVGKSIRFREAWGAACYAGYLIRARLEHGKCRPEFLSYFLSSKLYWDWIENAFIQATIQNVSAEKYADVPIPLPDISIQDAIVSFLDLETVKIDSLISKQSDFLARLDEHRQAMVSHAVTNGLNPLAPMQKSDVPTFPRIPAHWTVKPLMRLTPDDRQIMYGIVLPGPDVADGVPIVKGGDVKPGGLTLARLKRTTREIESGYVRSRLQAGDLVYAIRGTIGEVEEVPVEIEGANLTQDAARVAPRRDICGRWLMHTLRSPVIFGQLEAGSLGAAVQGINIRDLKHVKVPVPPLSEQLAIASHLDNLLARLSSTATLGIALIDRLKERRSALITAAVTGQIDVTDPALNKAAA
jgi:type I restriction enzyme, S subunit